MTTVAPAAAKPAEVASVPGVLRVVTTPWADVYVDDRKVGRAPIFRTMPLVAGAHTLGFVNPNYPPVIRKIKIEAGGVREVRVDLEKP